MSGLQFTEDAARQLESLYLTRDIVVKRNKNDAADAAAICEAVRRPTVRSVAVKTPQQQARLMQHRARELLIRQCTQLINAMRSHVGELGFAVAQGREGLKELLAIVRDGTDYRLPDDARASLSVLAAQLMACTAQIAHLEKRIDAQHRANEASRRLEAIPGIGCCRCDRHHGNSDRSYCLSDRSGLCGLGWPRATRGLNGRQTAARTHFQEGRPLPATHLDRRCACRFEARACSS